MAEFVEQTLEELVPVFEQLNATQLLSEKEINLLVKRCRRYDYRLQKSHKRPEDFLNYGEYLNDLLSLLEERRQSIGYNHKKEIIEFAINRKAAGIYRRLCERFQGRLEYWLQYIAFADSRNMKGMTSKAFVQAMQMHPRSLELRIKAARWEWEVNRSIDNARRGLQLALRLHPESVEVWATLFEIELEYVAKLKERKGILTGAAKKSGGVVEEEEEAISEPTSQAASDAVLQLRLAEIVMEQAVEAIGGLKETEGREERRRDLLVRLYRACLPLETATDVDAARLRAALDARMGEASAEGAQMQWRLEVERALAEGQDLVEALSSKDWKETSMEECRWAWRRLKERAEREEDAIATSRARELLSVMVTREESTEEECEEWARGLEEVEGDEQRRVIHRAVERFPRRALFRRVQLEAAGRQLEEGGVEKYAESINRAIEKAGDDEDSEEAVLIYQLAIDTAIQHAPSTVEKVWESALNSSTGPAHRRLKELRVDYLVSVVEGESEEAEREKRWKGVERHLKSLVMRRPNSVSFYIHLAEQLVGVASTTKSPSMTSSMDALIDETLAAGVAEHSESDDAWIARCELLMERAPLKVAEVYRRAMLSLKGEAAESFIGRYTILQQAAASKSR